MWSSSSSSSLLVLQQPSTLLLLSAFSSSGGGVGGGPRKAQWVCRPFSLEKRVNRMKQMRQFTVSSQLDLKSPPYHLDALEPHMSRQTFEYHWGKHHRSYVENLNKQILETELDQMSLEDIVIKTYNKGDLLPEFNNAAQAWNHEFFWESMKPGGGGSPSGILLEFIERDFGSFETFLKEFKAAALTQFGSGWAWLSYKANRIDVENAVNPHPTEKDKKLVISKSPNAMNPLVWDYTPLLTIDVWEHAYYLDYQNQRPNYVSVFMEKLVSWETVSARLDMAIEKEIRRVREEEERKKREEEERKRREEEERKQRKQGKERIEVKKEEETQGKEISEGKKEEEEMQ